LAAAGLGVWPNAKAVAQQKARFDLNLPSIAWYQQQLARVGYAVPQTGELDVTTRHVLAAFQMHFRPALYNGEPDAQSAAILQVLNGK
jgi:N-acetylmuramoyl-L-alanine amidase